MKDYLGVGFDLDGTLVDHEGAATTAIERYIHSLGETPTQDITSLWFAAEAAHYEEWRAGRITFAEQRRRRLRTLLAALKITGIETDADLDAAFQNYLAEYEAAWRPYPDAVHLLAELKQQGTKIGVLTNGNHAQQLAKLRRTGLLPYINAVCSSEQIGYAKPDPRAFRALTRALEVPAGSLIFIGDNPDHDVAAARNAGIRAAHINRRLTPEPRLQDALTAAR